MLKVVVLVAPLLILSGCCEVFGICTSVDVHTSIDRPEKVAQQPRDPENVPASAFDASLMMPRTGACTIASR